MSDHQPPAGPPDHPGDGEPDRPDDGDDAINRLFRQFGLSGPQGQVDLGALMSQVQGLLGAMGAQASASGVDWGRTKSLTRQYVASLGPDPSQTSLEARHVADAVRLAATWLAPCTALPEAELAAQAWSRAEWVEHSMDNWRAIAEPIVTHIADAMTGLMPPADRGDDLADGSPLAGFRTMFTPMIRQAAGAMYSQNLAQAIGRLATTVLSGNDSGLPLIDPPAVALLPTNVAAFQEGLQQSADDVRLYLALREVARQRLFASAPWLGTQVLALIEHYASAIVIDADALHHEIDLQDLDSLTPQRLAQASQALQGRLFSPARTPDQDAILERLETLTALIEGWVETVVATAAAPWMPEVAALGEMIRRRRAAGGPAEAMLSSLVGLQLRPRRLRDAVNLWTAVADQCGLEARDALWRHPDAVPTSADLDDIIGFVQRQNAPEATMDDLDAQLQRLLEQWDSPGAPGAAA